MASISLFLLALLVVSGVVSSQAHITGGLSDIDVNHHTVQDLVKALPSMTNDLDDLEIVSVVRAQVQVVSGLRYVLTIRTRGKGTDGPATQECEASVWIQSWLERRTLTSMTCKPVPELGIPGGWSKGEITDTVRQAANIGLGIINSNCNCMYRKSITQVKSVQQQVVAGMRYKITVGIIDTICRNSEDNQGKECPALLGASEQECEITIISQPWLNPKFRLEQHTCH